MTLSKPLFQKISLVTAIALTGSILVSAVAVAHSSAPVGSRTPNENQIVAKMPANVSLLVMDEGIGSEPTDFIHVWNSAGENVAGKLTAIPASDGTVLSAPATSNASGWYAANWSVQFSDGHISSDSMPSWWAFGVAAKTVPAKVTKFTLPSSFGADPELAVSISGLKVGLRKLSIPVKGNIRGSVQWTLAEPALASQSPVKGAQFSWTLTNTGKSKTMGTSQGILPVGGKYLVVVSYQPLSLSSATATKTWSGWVMIAS
jgi:methionine-rich copper-binding protein CopC